MRNVVLKTRDETKMLLDLVGGDEKALRFLSEWLNNGRNAKRAYLKLHPKVTEHSAEVLGSRQLRKVEISSVLAAYGLGIETYIKQLKVGLNATDRDGNPDHRTRRLYHRVLGEILEIEGRITESANINQINFLKIGEDMARRARERGIVASDTITSRN